jgi:hypothetical protein
MFLSGGAVLVEEPQQRDPFVELGLEHAERLEEVQIDAPRVVGALHDLLAHGLPLEGIRVEDPRTSEPLEDVGNFPGEIVRVLDRGVRAQAVGGRVAMDGVTDVEAVSRG